MDIVIISGVMNVRITAFVVTVLNPGTPGASDPQAEPETDESSQPGRDGGTQGWNGSGAAESRPTSAMRRDDDIRTYVVPDGSPPQVSVCEPEADDDALVPVEEQDVSAVSVRDGIRDAETKGRPPQSPLTASASESDPRAQRQARGRRLTEWSESCQLRRCQRCLQKSLEQLD